MNKLSKRLMPIMVASAMLGGNDMPYGYSYIKRPKRDYHFTPSDPHQDKGACSKKVRKGAGKRLSRAERKRRYGK